MARAGLKARQSGSNAALNAVWFVFYVILNVIFYAIALFLIYRACVFAYDFSYQVFGNETVDSAPGRNALITINKGASSMEIASKLEMNKIVKNRYSFYLKVKLVDSEIQAGSYILNSSMTYDEILKTITDYKNAVDPDKMQ
ncbi:MAG: endolytic transglycosylase MltG [Lachnospiraceae bacterium]|nr:endolytic transglycosylase MltG [Lachnospiraceae bacterium]MBP5249817.1 endolytic transglycosylase MltG [Lachnospiraceae bacterium]